MNRDTVSEKYKWDLSLIYSDSIFIKKDINKVLDGIKEITKYEDVILDANNLYDLIDLCMSTSKILEKLDVYANLLCDEDTSINKNLELKEEKKNKKELVCEKASNNIIGEITNKGGER